MAPLYKKVLVIGATSGIGEALAVKLLEEGSSVIVTGRRVQNLDAFVAKHGSSNVSKVAFDVTDLKNIPSIAAAITTEHPDLDCIVMNSGVQRAFDFSKPESVDLDIFDNEITTNYISYVHMIKAFLPHLQKVGKEKQTHMVFVSASLGLVPTLLATPAYNASKAALHSFITAVRAQLKDAGHNVRLVEVFPPAVQTELHDEKHQPHLKDGGQIGMPLPQYTELMYAGLQKGADQFAIGPAEPWLAEGGFEAERQKIFEKVYPAITANLSKFLADQK